jgi:hypothetical protein
LSDIIFLKFKKLFYTSYSWAKDKPDTLIIVFALIFLHSAMHKSVIATHRARLPEKEGKRYIQFDKTIIKESVAQW